MKRLITSLAAVIVVVSSCGMGADSATPPRGVPFADPFRSVTAMPLKAENFEREAHRLGADIVAVDRGHRSDRFFAGFDEGSVIHCGAGAYGSGCDRSSGDPRPNGVVVSRLFFVSDNDFDEDDKATLHVWSSEPGISVVQAAAAKWSARNLSPTDLIIEGRVRDLQAQLFEVRWAGRDERCVVEIGTGAARC